ncbi:A-kinase anchor protein inhibitor 1 isoform X2 [Heptranchias perlo]|uniref:A-kinase anchor protein inhibitor 1 isoform X2 n=1 Tax=Heptranchias perlo TaxID=212740 RepID=UPI00355A041C
MYTLEGDKPENEPQEEELWVVSKQIVEKAVLQAVQQYSQERKRKEKKAKAKKGSLLQASDCPEQREKKK